MGNLKVSINDKDRLNSFLLWYIFNCSFINKLSLILVALILLSPFGFHILNIGGYYLIEIFIGFIFILYGVINKKVFNEMMTGVRFPLTVIMFLLLLVLMIVGIFILKNPQSSYSDFRSLLIFSFTFLFFLYSKTNIKNKLNIIVIIAFLSSVFSIVYPLVYVSEGTKNSYPIFSVIILMYVSAIKKSPLLLVISTIIASYMALTSFYRSYWIIIGICIFLFTLLLFIQLNIFKNKKAIYLIILIIFLTLISIGIINSGFLNSYLNSSESRYIQSIGKWKDLTNTLFYNQDLSESDEMRVAYYEYIIDNWTNLILPHGLGYEGVFGNLDNYFIGFSIPPNTIDTSFLYLSYHFGLLLTLIFFIFLLKKSNNKLKRISIIEKCYVLVGLATVILYASIAGDIFTVIQKAFFAGAFLGVILNKNINSKLWESNK